MGSGQTHPKLKGMNTVEDIKEEIKQFNSLEQNQLEKDLNARITFKNTMKLVDEMVKSAVLKGSVIVNKQQYPIEMTLSNFFELYDMVSNLINQRNSQSVGKKAEEDQTCCTCLDVKSNRMLPCSHCLCQTCMQKYFLGKSEKLCPICRADFSNRDSIREKITDIYENEEVLDLLISDIRELLIKTNPSLKKVLIMKK